ncbi:unnamed protein product [Lepeophtheirus salmonis]|uniref:(salmon louse) hypothetical protein n=1 Tax=Lepeophtheirus salmonis TaxID=72036 RepID=A0A7R8CR78_LEPSM|nr:unnamed protein product [Lepeophtheirus salmonis]CAF2902543.1 unnamed protein product [Lepeophtheirus salmonis]
MNYFCRIYSAPVLLYHHISIWKCCIYPWDELCLQDVHLVSHSEGLLDLVGSAIQKVVVHFKTEYKVGLDTPTCQAVSVTPDTDCLANLCYLADVFSKLNTLNTSLQAKDTSVLSMYDKVGGFLKKAQKWTGADVNRTPVQSIIVPHFTNLIQDFHSYFPDLEKKFVELDKEGDTFLLSEANRSKLPVTDQEQLLKVSSYCGLQLKFAKFTLTQVWVSVKQEYPDLGQKALEQLLPFASTYLCEASFSLMTVIKTM